MNAKLATKLNLLNYIKSFSMPDYPDLGILSNTFLYDIFIGSCKNLDNYTLLYGDIDGLRNLNNEIGYKNADVAIEELLKKTKLKRTRGLSIAIVYVLVIAMISLIMKFIIPAVISSIVDFVGNIQSYYNSITIDSIGANWAPWLKDNVLKPIVDFIQTINVQEMFTPDRIKTYIDSAFGAVKSILNIFIALICSIYILAGKEQITQFIHSFAKAVMTENGYNKFVHYFTNGNQIFFRFISSQVIDGFIVAAITCIAMSIIGVKYSLLLGVFIGISNLIPYFGAIVGVGVSIIITLLTGGWKQAIIMAIVVVVLQQIDANIINPRITGSRLQISPLLVIFAVTIGGAYFGVIGMFIAVPIATLIKLMVQDFIEEKKNNP